MGVLSMVNKKIVFIDRNRRKKCFDAGFKKINIFCVFRFLLRFFFTWMHVSYFNDINPQFNMTHMMQSCSSILIEIYLFILETCWSFLTTAQLLEQRKEIIKEVNDALERFKGWKLLNVLKIVPFFSLVQFCYP